MKQNKDSLAGSSNNRRKPKRSFHKQVRVVYRACRKLYGKERTQDECLRVFKVVFPILYKARHSENTNFHFQVEDIEKLEKIFGDWHLHPHGALDQLCCHVLNEADVWKWKAEFIQFCEDILPVVMRIRKLTPTETGRLMGLRDEEILKMYDAGLSNSAMYKLHGNSIVVDVMTALFDKMLINTEQEKKAGMQLSLF